MASCVQLDLAGLRYVELLEDFCEDLPSALPLVRSEGEEPVWSGVGKGHPEEEALALDQFPQKQAKEEMKTVLGNFKLVPLKVQTPMFLTN